MSDYNSLVSAVQAVAEDNGEEFIAFIPTAVANANSRLEREIESEDIQVVASITCTVSTATISKPSDYRIGMDLFISTSAGLKHLTKTTYGHVRDYWPDETVTDEPKYYADKNRSLFILAPTPVSSYSGELSYVPAVSALSSSSPVNALTTYFPDGLFYATMSNMAEFMKDYDTQKIWEGKLENALVSYGNEKRRYRRDNGVVPRNPDGGINTLVDGST